MTTHDKIAEAAKIKYPGKTKKAGPHGVIVREKRAAFIAGATDPALLQEHFEKFLAWYDGDFIASQLRTTVEELATKYINHLNEKTNEQDANAVTASH